MKKILSIQLIILALFFTNSCVSDIHTNVEETEITEETKTSGKIALTFDDSACIDTWLDYLDFFEDHEIKVTFYIDRYISRRKELKPKLKIIEKNGHEIGCHTTSHKNAIEVVNLNGLDLWLENEVLLNTNAMKDDGFEINSFAYPFGAHNDETDNILKNYYQSIRTFINITKLPNPYDATFDNFKKLGIGIDTAYFRENLIYEYIDEAIEKEESIVFVAHAIENWTNGFHIKEEELKKVILYAKKNGLEFVTMTELSKIETD